jgi:GNAT superfamily N-acetyltransferase
MSTSRAATLPTEPTELDWMELHLRCLHQHDEHGRIVRTRQPNTWPSPLFHLGRTRLGNLWRFRDDLDPHAIRELARLAGREPALGADHAPPERLQAMRSVLASVTELAFEWRGPAFRFPDPIIDPVAADDEASAMAISAVSAADAPLLAEDFTDAIPQLAVREPCFAAIHGGRAVSLCYSARPREVSGLDSCAAAEASVETAPGHRGRGLAPRVVAAWARAVRSRGGHPMYSTSWSNRASRGVARKLGLILYGEDLHFS